jgi:transcriptional regulator with XRE-family HTH domain
MNFGKMLREKRKERGKTMGDIARALGCAVSYVSDVELGRRKPFQSEQITKIARALGGDPDDELKLHMAAAHERGSVSITNPKMQGIATALARTGDRLSAEQIEQIEAVLRRAEEGDE